MESIAGSKDAEYFKKIHLFTDYLRKLIIFINCRRIFVNFAIYSYRELKKTIPSTFAWPLPITTTVKLPKFQLKHDVESLISQELPDEESDDEYDPTQEEPVNLILIFI